MVKGYERRNTGVDGRQQAGASVLEMVRRGAVAWIELQGLRGDLTTGAWVDWWGRNE